MRPDDHRRKWDHVEYEKNAKARLDLEDALERARESKGETRGEVIERDRLKAREYQVDLDSRLGKSTVITKNTPQVWKLY
jgi:hypothetical protein